MRVLLVDDEEELVATMSERLDLRGIYNRWATNGEEGVRMAFEQPYDWLIIDLKMPGLGGLGAIKAIKEKQPDSKIIVLTGQSEPDALENAKAMGADYALVKPVDIGDLLAVMQENQKD
ncbi:MAG: response regulator [Deltaproteobacteria bacterium]|nr:response regulator [Deltaproteobacteria bacterium]